MNPAQKGDTVSVHYTGRLEDGSVFDSSEGREPLEFTLGSGQVIAGFDAGVTGMMIGDSKTVTVPVADAYGARLTELLVMVPHSKLPKGVNPKIGDDLQMTKADGVVQSVKVVNRDEAVIVIDANHPLAGKVLVFELTRVSPVA